MSEKALYKERMITMSSNLRHIADEIIRKKGINLSDLADQINKDKIGERYNEPDCTAVEIESFLNNTIVLSVNKCRSLCDVLNIDKNTIHPGYFNHIRE